MIPEIRSPFAALQAAIHARCQAVLPSVPVYSAVPDHEAYPYIFLGAFTDKPSYDDVESIVHECTYALQFWTQSDSPAQVHAHTNAVMGGVTRADLALTDDWKLLESSVDSLELYEVAMDEFGHLFHGTVLFRFLVEDGR